MKVAIVNFILGVVYLFLFAAFAGFLAGVAVNVFEWVVW